jgi:hypothetical protein
MSRAGKIEDMSSKTPIELSKIGKREFNVGVMSYMQKLKVRMKRIETPAVYYIDKTLCGVPNEESLKRLIRV